MAIKWPFSFNKRLIFFMNKNNTWMSAIQKFAVTLLMFNLWSGCLILKSGHVAPQSVTFTPDSPEHAGVGHMQRL